MSPTPSTTTVWPVVGGVPPPGPGGLGAEGGLEQATARPKAAAVAVHTSDRALLMASLIDLFTIVTYVVPFRHPQPFP